MFFYEILRIGYDCRSDGIQWILTALQNNGDKVTEGDLPVFLDE